MKFYCLHHTPAIDRKEYLLDFFNKENINPTWIENYLPDCEEVQLYKNKVFSQHAANGVYLNDAEVSCFLKHCQAIENIAANNEVSVILEDDIEVPNFSLLEFCKDIEKACRNDLIIFIGSYTGSDLLSSSNEARLFISPYFKSRCAHAYMMNATTARKISLELNNILMPFDWQLNYIIDKLKLTVGWTAPHINQRTEKGQIKSLLR